MSSLDAMSDLELKQYCQTLNLEQLLQLSRDHLIVYFVCRDIIKDRRQKRRTQTLKAGKFEIG